MNITTAGGGFWNTAIVTLYSGGCSSLSAVQCSTGPGIFNVVEGEQYFMQISGSDISDQEDFTLSLESTRDCNTCVTGSTFNANPGPNNCLLYTSPSPRDQRGSRMPSSA